SRAAGHRGDDGRSIPRPVLRALRRRRVAAQHRLDSKSPCLAEGGAWCGPWARWSGLRPSKTSRASTARPARSRPSTGRSAFSGTPSIGGRTPPIFTGSPFHRFGVKIRTKVETKRDRRITPDEERRLLEAADKLNCAEHAFAGAQMRDRIVGALETASRLGEMLKIQNRHVLWDTHQIIIPADHAKDAESRRIPFEPKGRLAHLLKRRRFLGPKGFVFGAAKGEYQGTIRTAWESLVLQAHGIERTRTRVRGRVNRDQLAEIDLHWHDLRLEAACRWLTSGL